jgi:hypothetical protein
MFANTVFQYLLDEYFYKVWFIEMRVHKNYWKGEKGGK